jgi:hypothetical protein
MKTILTQEQADTIKAKPVNEQVEFLLELFDEGTETMEANREILKNNFAKVFHLTVMEVTTAALQTTIDAMSNPEIEKFTDEQGKEYIKNKIINNVVANFNNI